MDFSERTELIIGKKGIDSLKRARVLVCGLGGVGGCVVEALARAGVGNIGVLDNDVFTITNLNRQILATTETVGRRKTEVARERILSVNPNCRVDAYDFFYLPESANKIDLRNYDYIVDAIDTVTAKLELICRAKSLGVKIISCMGTGNKIYADFKVGDIKTTSVCPLARIMRKELKNRGIESLKVLYSTETPLVPLTATEENGRHLPGSLSYVPPVAGFMLAGEVIREIIAATEQ